MIKSTRRAPELAKARKQPLPGLGLTLGCTLVYLALIVLLPLTALGVSTLKLSWTEFIGIVSAPRLLAAYQLSFGASLLAALINSFFGLTLAWVLVRYRFPGRRWVDALIDLPFALPTAVAGLALSALYASDGWIGSRLEPFGIQVAFTRLGVLVALIFIGLPFLVRTVQPVLAALDQSWEEAAATLGASRWQRFYYVILPALLPALLTGFALAFARAIGEYGSVIFIAGNLPMESEIAPLLIITKLEQYDYQGASAVATVLLLVSFALLMLINLLQRRAELPKRERIVL